jgi:3-methylcrotonyl-CoA carboxylase alpha subunit
MVEAMLPSRVLIANRGEIAIRIAETCRRLGIESIGVFAASDAGTLFTRRLDRAMPIGGRTAADSYLRGDLIIQTALDAGAEALHPGYGFLSEHAEFAQACAEAGLIFIGPPPAAMRLLGNKIAALRLAGELGMPTLPGYYDDDQSMARLAVEADHIGFPLLIKAAAGGGGRGMRVVYERAALTPSIEAARREAAAAFGDGAVFLERYISAPRHVEVQVLADLQGTVLALGDRDCTVQRRHQKVVEEAPAPALDDGIRAAMHEASRRLAGAAGYTSAGTIEFLVDGSQFYFLEMNTRLQVEHPVTEQTAGVDIVELQIRIAAGERIASLQPHIAPRGHAVEARLYAEDPSAGFLPSAGRLERCVFPHMPGVRIDAGVAEGDHVTTYFDPLLAKLIGEGPTREVAIRRLRAALAQTTIAGLATNRDFLLTILGHPTFLAAQHTTGFLAEFERDLVPRLSAPDPDFWFAAAIAAALPSSLEQSISHDRASMQTSVWSEGLGAWRHAAASQVIALSWRHETRKVMIRRDSAGAWHESPSGLTCAVTTLDTGAFEAATPGAAARLRVTRHGLRVLVSSTDRADVFSIAPSPALAGQQTARAPSHAALTAPMPGTIIKQFVEVGAAVSANQPLLAIEAMKMEHIIAAPYAGIVASMPFAVGSMATAGAVLAEVAPSEDVHDQA